MIITIEVEFEIRQVVYLKTDRDQLPRIVCCYNVYDTGQPMYKLVCGTIESYHHGFEISLERDTILASE